MSDFASRWVSVAGILLCTACEGGGGGAGVRPLAAGGARNTGGSAGTSGAGTGLSGAGGTAATLAPWQAEDLGEGQCLAINEKGQVLGLDAEGTFLVDADRKRTALGSMPDGASAVGVALGPKGDVVGFSESESGRAAIRYTSDGWQVLPGVEGTWSVAASIDERGRIVGTVGTSDGAHQAYVWERDGSELLVPSSKGSSGLVGVGGRIAGVMLVDELTHAFVALDDGKVTDLGTLGGNTSNPFALNASGTVVGAAHDDAGAISAFIWKPGGTMENLGVPDGARGSEARGVDSAGRVLGNVIDTIGMAHGAFFDIDNGLIRELPLPDEVDGVSFVAARVVAMAPDGRGVGSGAVQGSRSKPIHCVLWSPL